MKTDPVATAYASALLDVAVDAGRDPDDFAGDLIAAAEGIHGEDETVARFFRAPAVPVETKRAFVEKAFAKADPVVLNFLKLLVDNRRLESLPAITEEYRDRCNEHHGRSIASVTSAIELTAPVQKRLQASLEKIEGRPVVVDPTVDPAIVGGLVVRLGDRLWDGSVRRNIENLQRLLQKVRIPLEAGFSS